MSWFCTSGYCGVRPPVNTNWKPNNFSAASSNSFSRKRWRSPKNEENPFVLQLSPQTTCGTAFSGLQLHCNPALLWLAARREKAQKNTPGSSARLKKLGDQKPQFNLEIHMPN